jgi:hypothetical protein
MKNIARFISVAATVFGLSLLAQDDIEEETSATSEETSEGGEGADVGIDIGGQIHHAKSEPKFFYTLPTVAKLEGTADVLKPGARDWEAASEGRYYPLGSVFRTIGETTRLTVAFGRECKVVIVGEASFGTRGQGLAEKSRAILLKGGVIVLDLPRNLPEGLFFVDAPGFSVVNPAGKSAYRYVKTGDGDKATIRCVTGSLAIQGLHFKILSMRAANEVCIQTSQDALFTGIYGTRGDYICKLDQGLVKIRDVETGESHTEQKFLEWKISPKTAVRIQRAVPEIGENMAVTVMTFDATGNLKNRCAFAENRFEVNSGELAPHDKDSQAELEKKAAEATSDTGTVETEAVETTPEDDGGNGASAGDSSDDDLEF